MSKHTFIAFGTIRRSETAYTCASRCNRWGIVRFHTTIAAARRMGDVAIEDVREATPEEIRVDRAAKKAERAARAARLAAW